MRITGDQWDEAMTRTTFTSMGNSLVMSSYPQDTLLESNVRGGKNKINKDAKQLEALDSHILGAIKCNYYKAS